MAKNGPKGPGSKHTSSKYKHPETGEQLNQIELIAIPGYGQHRDAVTLILPVYLEDIERTDKNLRSALNDLAPLTLLSGRRGFKKAKPFKTRLRDLVGYNFTTTRQPNYVQLGQDLTKGISDDGYQNLTVSVFESLPFLITKEKE